ncbi:hypothetical protein [Amycolatopsis samaneae]|uniref:Uncharacterized protein n=1 Tax=Amycolatopsis samaneae TaxID=664691 RepID=A0ABW5GX83_9PSEU
MSDSEQSPSANAPRSPDEPPERREFGRRPILGLLAFGSGAALLGAVSEMNPAGVVGDFLGVLLGAGDPAAPPAPLLAVRPDDGLFATLSFTNLDVKTSLGQPPRLALRDAASDGLIILGLTPQSVFEQTTFDNGTGAPTPSQPIPALVSGPSRIVLRVPAGTAPFPYDLPTLLDLARYPLAVSPSADGTAPPAAPRPGETAIEAPFRLFLSPPSAALFAAAKNPVTRNGRTELWHARAVPRLPGGGPQQDPTPVPVRAIWTPDMLLPPVDLPDWAKDQAKVSLLPQDRHDIVVKTAEAPAQSALLLVSPMGASLDVDGRWTSNGLIGWRHRSWLGRDTYVRVERAGYLFPFGFPAEAVDITERVIQDGVAFLRKRQFVVVRRPHVDYAQSTDPAINPQPFFGRNQPFTRATTSTLVSPPLAKLITSGDFVQIAGQDGKATDLRYQVTLTTKDGRTVTSDVPLVFLFDSDALTMNAIKPFVAKYSDDTQTPVARRTLALGGQKVAYVPPAPPADHSLPTTSIVLAADLATRNRDAAGTDKEQAAFPVLKFADVRVEELDALGGPQQGTRLSYEDKIYLGNGLGGTANSGEVWAKLRPVPAAATSGTPAAGPGDETLRFALSQATGGGMAAPRFAVDALSRVHGTITDLENIATNHFDPRAYFQDEAIKLFGAIPLSKVIEPDKLTDIIPPTDENIPKIKTNRTGDRVETVVTWNPKLKQFPDGAGNLFTFVPATTDPDRRLRLEVRFTTTRDGVTSSVVRGELRNASLVFLDMIAQPIERLTFESHNGAKPAIDLKLGLPNFRGDLRFLTKLQEFLPALPGGVKIDRLPTGVKAGMTLAVPSVPIGVVLVQNLSVGVLLDLPFTGAPATLNFSFGTREHPFRCTVMALGGGGFLTIGLSTAGGPPMIEGSLEFGAAVALDLGVASGSVSIMAGIYLAYGPRPSDQGPPGPSTIVITGYVRAIGELSVLGLIHASLEFYLGLTFEKQGGAEGRVQGEATLRVRVEVFLFSTTVSVTLRKEIGSGVDPSFGDQISAADWSAYCAAFA